MYVCKLCGFETESIRDMVSHLKGWHGIKDGFRLLELYYEISEKEYLKLEMKAQGDTRTLLRFLKEAERR